MQLKHDAAQGKYRIEKVSKQDITINGTDYSTPVWISPETLIAPWQAQSVASLNTTLLMAEKLPAGTILILGTGESIIWPKDELYQSLLKLDIVLEVMNTAAACRTYQLLLSELRLTAAALFPPNYLENQ